MVDYKTLKDAVRNAIKTNGNQEITGEILQSILLNIITTFGDDYKIAGMIVPSSVPGADKSIYFTVTPGTYALFGNITVEQNELFTLISYDGNVWSKKTLLQKPTNFVEPSDLSIYDISKNNSGAAFTLEKAIAKIPEALRRGGISIRFIEKESNNYVEYTNVSTSWSTNVKYWVQAGKDENLISIMNIKLGDKNTTVYKIDGTTYKGDNWSSGAKIRLSGKYTFRIVGKLYLYRNFAGIVCFNKNDEIIKYIAANNTAVEQTWIDIDTSKEGQEIPKDTEYIVLQSATYNSNVLGDVYIDLQLKYLYPILTSMINQLVDMQGNDYIKSVEGLNLENVSNKPEAYRPDGSKWSHDNVWSIVGEQPIRLLKNMQIRGIICCYKGIIPPIVFLNFNKKFVGCIDDTTQPETHFATIDFRADDASVVPQNAYYFIVQSAISDVSKNKNKLQIILPYNSLFDSKFYKEDNEGYANSEILAPRVIYSLANNSTVNSNSGFSARTTTPTLYIENFVYGLTKEPKALKFGNGLRTLNIPFISKGYNTYESAKLIDGTKKITEESVNYSIVGNYPNQKQDFILKHRCCINSAMDKITSVLFIGDSITYGQNAFFADRKRRATYPMLVNEMAQADYLAFKKLRGLEDYILKTVGTLSWKQAVNIDGESVELTTYHEGRQGDTLQNFMKNTLFVDSLGNFSLEAYLDNYRTCDNNGNRLYFKNGSSLSLTGTPGSNNIGYYENGEASDFEIGVKISNTTVWDVFKPTHVFMFMGTNATYSKELLDEFIKGIHTAGMDINIGVGCPHYCGTYFPSEYPNFIGCEHWTLGECQTQIDQQKLLNSLDSTVYEDNNVYFIDTYWTNPGAYSASVAEVNNLAARYDNSEHFKKYITLGQGPHVHVSSYACCAYAEQIYAWIKWTMQNI